MRKAYLALVLAISTVALAPAEGLLRPSAQATCTASPRRDLLPEVIAPHAGESPVWFVDGGGGVWQGPGMPIKSVWILDRRVAGALRVNGRNLQTNESLTFREGMEGAITSSLVIEAPLAHSMIPGGASAEVMRKFAFVSSYVFYPSPGCWELTAQLGNEQQKFVAKLD
jgi:hypothetical protein